VAAPNSPIVIIATSQARTRCAGAKDLTSSITVAACINTRNPSTALAIRSPVVQAPNVETTTYASSSHTAPVPIGRGAGLRWRAVQARARPSALSIAFPTTIGSVPPE